ncbi:c-type cytochrome [Catenovulum adriaticum]|uniref:C-type cytochrome n=1 Tax=Catenovulum adriaticum TaxID=2984846 RepID=A0ABY7AQX5_9ALTE|nr:cytochrome c [Catenovulum sp. TS8]WAJ71672.1 c-type cytochrome [Catenovulum sp. TS8]
MNISMRAFTIITLGITISLSLDCVAREHVDDGQKLMISKGCSSCHQLAKLPSAKGLVGPPLDNMALQSYIAGVLPNSRENLTKFLLNPQQFHPDTAMPKPEITQQEAQRLTDYLWKD